MEPRKSIIHIEQTLHGYSDGHRLLESSINLSQQIQRVMLILSDMSGPSMVPGYESYITGYPLQGIALYALGKTWYASEMNRPGCVWTHTLLIRNADLGIVEDLRALLKLFNRPLTDGRRNAYKTPFEFPVGEITDRSLESYNVSSMMVSHLFEALYGKPEYPLYIASQNAEKFENLVLSIWSQQWPNLRKSFSFCTGSIANRKMNGQSFDIQVVSAASLSQLKREVPHSVILSDVDSNKFTPNLPKWIEMATLDLSERTNKKLRHFLWDFGGDISSGRSAFVPLINVYSCIEEVKADQLSLTNLTETLSKSFPASEEAATLKSSVFTLLKSEQQRLIPNVKRTDLLIELLTTKYYTAFDPKSLNFQKCARELWTDEASVAKDLVLKLVDSELNPLGEEFLTGISKIVNVSDAISLSRQRAGLLYVLLNRNSNLARSPDLWSWSANKDTRLELFEAVLHSPNISLDDRIAIVRAMLEAGVDDVAADVVKHFKQDAIFAALEWFDENFKVNSSYIRSLEKWAETLKSHPGALLKWLEKSDSPHVETAALLTKILDPNSRLVLDYGARIWLNLSIEAPSRLDKRDLIEAMAFILAIGFNNPGEGAVELVACSFEIVYDAAANNQLEYHSWQHLERHAPSLSWWRDWDKCERLRRALVERFVKYNWSPEQFLRTVRRKDTFLKIIDYWHETSEGRSFLGRLANQVTHGKVNPTDEQKKALLAVDRGYPEGHR